MPKITLEDERDYLEWRLGSGRSVEILDVAVGSERRQGRGTRLLAHLLHDIPQDASLIFAITRISNTIAHEWYEKNGFRIVGRLHKFYRDGDGTESALMYGKDI